MRKIWQSCCHKFYPPAVPHCVFQLLSQMAHVRFHRRKWVLTRLRQQDRTQRPTRRNRGVSDGALSLPSERSARSQTSPGRVSERRTLPLLGLGRERSRRTQKAFGAAMRLCASLLRGVAAPLGCVIQGEHDLLRIAHLSTMPAPRIRLRHAPATQNSGQTETLSGFLVASNPKPYHL